MDQLTYQDLTGRRKPRRYVTAALVILLFLMGLAWAGLARRPAAATRDSADHPASEPGSQAPVLFVSPFPEPSEEIGVACPADPESWALIEIFPGDNYRKIEPACVLDGVARTAAWMLAERSGYSRPEAAHLFGFDVFPERFQAEVLAYANLQGPVERELLAEWPPHPDFFFWQLDREGRPAVVISLRGCYRLDAAVYCVLALDRVPGTAVSVLGTTQVASPGAHLPGSRAFFLLVYVGENVWHLVGQFADASVETSDPGALQVERDQVTGRLGVETWDSDWLFDRFDIAMKPLPQDWRLLGFDQAAFKMIGDELNRYRDQVGGGRDE